VYTRGKVKEAKKKDEKLPFMDHCTMNGSNGKLR